jgi:hypothetical protein
MGQISHLFKYVYKKNLQVEFETRGLLYEGDNCFILSLRFYIAITASPRYSPIKSYRAIMYYSKNYLT